MRVIVTGDTHGSFARIQTMCRVLHTTPEDVCVILGDAGINLLGPKKDRSKKELLGSLPITVFAIQGNHDMRPVHVPSCKLREYRGGMVWSEEAYPNILYARDGDIFDFGGRSCLVVGGAYSVDKLYRIEHGWPWFADEMPDEEIRQRTRESLERAGWRLDYVFTHTGPVNLLPFDNVNHAAAREYWWSEDLTTEMWLQEIYDALDLTGTWYAGHVHREMGRKKVQFLYEKCCFLGAEEPFDIWDEILEHDGLMVSCAVDDKDGLLHARTINTAEYHEFTGRVQEEVVAALEELSARGLKPV